MKKYQEDYFLHLKILQYYFGGNKQKANFIHKLSRRLTAKGFEKYCVVLLNKVYGISLRHTGKVDEPDGGLDGIDFKNHIYLQCKKYIVGLGGYKGKVSVSQMKEFIASIIIIENGKSQKYLDGFFITTGFFTKTAKDVANKCGIQCIDFRELYELSQIYPLNDFEKEYSDSDLYDYYQLKIDFEAKKSPEALSQYLKSVREKLCFINYGNETNNGLIFTDSILENYIQKYKKGLKNDFSEFKSYKPSIEKALKIWES